MILYQQPQPLNPTSLPYLVTDLHGSTSTTFLDSQSKALYTTEHQQRDYHPQVLISYPYPLTLSISNSNTPTLRLQPPTLQHLDHLNFNQHFNTSTLQLISPSTITTFFTLDPNNTSTSTCLKTIAVPHLSPLGTATQKTQPQLVQQPLLQEWQRLWATLAKEERCDRICRRCLEMDMEE